MTEVTLKNKKPNEKKLLAFGFEKQDDGYIYLCDVADAQMSMTVTVSPEGRVYAEVSDKSTAEEYVLHLVAEACGIFVGQVREAYETVLEKISAACFDPQVFKGKQTHEIIAYVRKRYGDEPEYLWQRFPDNAVVRRRDNQKWYAALLTVSRRKLGLDSDDSVEIIDLRIRPEELGATVDNKKYFPGYHMNKKHWITVCLDSTVATEEIIERIDESYGLASK